MPPRIPLHCRIQQKRVGHCWTWRFAGSGRIASTGELTYLQDDCGPARPPLHMRRGLRGLLSFTRAGWPHDRRTKRTFVARHRAPGQSAQVAHRHRRGGGGPCLPRLCPRPFSAISVLRRAPNSSSTARNPRGRRGGGVPLALSLLAGLDVRILHLTRDPRHTMQTYVTRGSNWVLEGHRAPRPFETWRPILGWTMANRICAPPGPEDRRGALICT